MQDFTVQKSQQILLLSELVCFYSQRTHLHHLGPHCHHLPHHCGTENHPPIHKNILLHYHDVKNPTIKGIQLFQCINIVQDPEDQRCSKAVLPLEQPWHKGQHWLPWSAPSVTLPLKTQCCNINFASVQRIL